MEQTPPPYASAEEEKSETPMFGSTASKPAEAPAEPSIEDTFLSHLRPGFWD